MKIAEPLRKREKDTPISSNDLDFNKSKQKQNEKLITKSTKGLTQKEAERRLKEYGYNTILSKKRISPLKILFAQFTDFMVLILMAATAISAFMGDITEAITIIAIVIVNSILGFLQEYRTERTMEALKNLAAPTASVIREGNLENIPADEIVPGDLIVLESGDRVPADALLTEIKSLQVEESMLTGESLPVDKQISTTSRNNKKEYGFQKNHVYMGTIVVGGRGKAVVISTGMNTEMGKIADMIENIEEEETPLQKRLEQLGKLIVFACLVICSIVTATGVLRGEDLFNMLLSGISLAVAAIPEGLPAIVTIALALGVQRMLKRNALIRKLPAVETLGCASVICSDKTGTLTENKMTVRKVYASESIIEVKGSGFEKEGEFVQQGRAIKLSNTHAAKFALEIGAVCNNSKVIRVTPARNSILGKVKYLGGHADSWKIIGDPTEAALLIAAVKAGIDSDVIESTYTRLDEIPFDSDRKCMSVICDKSKGDRYLFTKGAPDIIIKKCSKLLTSNGISEMNPALRTGILKVNDSLASEALRVLGVAYRKLPLGSHCVPDQEMENDLIFVGLIGMIDPPRREAMDAVAKCRLAGIKPVMITGDHKITATAIARELNIYTKGEKVLTGTELEMMSDQQLEREVDNVSVYARVSPKHKLAIVRALKSNGHIVAMTGDGVNDAPAIKEADIGISMGITGTDVTKEASSMILMDDNFATIVAAVEEGRVIYSNIRKFIRYLLACNIGEVLTMFIGTLAGLPIPLLPIQILWVNLVTDGLPAIALGLEPPEKDVMMHPPRRSNANIFADGLLGLIVLRGVLLSISTLSVYVSILYFTQDVSLSRSGAFVTLVLTQLTHVFECKSERKTLFQIPLFNNVLLVLAVLVSLCMILAVIYIPFLQPIFKTAALGLNEWSLVVGFTALGPIVSSLLRSLKRPSAR